MRLGAVGDVVRTLPAARALRAAWPEAHLAWLVEPASASLLEGQRWLDEVVVFPRGELREALVGGRVLEAARGGLAFRRSLRAGGFDLVVDFHAILKSGFLGWLSGAPRRVSYARPFAREGAQWFATDHARLAPPRQSRFERNAGLAEYLAAAVPVGRVLEVPNGPLGRARSELGRGAPVVAIHPGTSAHTPYKRWTTQGYAAVARALWQEDGQRTVVTSGDDPAESAFADAIVAASEGAARRGPAYAGPAGSRRGVRPVSALHRERHGAHAPRLPGGHPRRPAARADGPGGEPTRPPGAVAHRARGGRLQPVSPGLRRGDVYGGDSTRFGALCGAFASGSRIGGLVGWPPHLPGTSLAGPHRGRRWTSRPRSWCGGRTGPGT